MRATITRRLCHAFNLYVRPPWTRDFGVRRRINPQLASSCKLSDDGFKSSMASNPPPTPPSKT